MGTLHNLNADAYHTFYRLLNCFVALEILDF